MHQSYEILLEDPSGERFIVAWLAKSRDLARIHCQEHYPSCHILRINLLNDWS